MVITLLLPLSALLTTALTRGFGQALNWQTLTLENFQQALWGYPAIRQAFFTSLWLTGLTALLLSVMALFLAFFLSWHRTRLVRGLGFASELTYALPGIVTGVAAMLFSCDRCRCWDFLFTERCGLFSRPIWPISWRWC